MLGDALQPLVGLMKDQLESYDIAAIDATTLHHDIPLLDDMANGFRGFLKRGEIRCFVFIDRGWYRDDVDVGAFEGGSVTVIRQVPGRSELCWRDFLCDIDAGLQF